MALSVRSWYTRRRYTTERIDTIELRRLLKSAVTLHVAQVKPGRLSACNRKTFGTFDDNDRALYSFDLGLVCGRSESPIVIEVLHTIGRDSTSKLDPKIQLSFIESTIVIPRSSSDCVRTKPVEKSAICEGAVRGLDRATTSGTTLAQGGLPGYGEASRERRIRSSLRFSPLVSTDPHGQ